MALAIMFTVWFPMKKKEFEIIKKDIARRTGEDDSAATEEEIKVCEKLTGFSYDRLWDPENALSFKSK